MPKNKRFLLVPLPPCRLVVNIDEITWMKSFDFFHFKSKSMSVMTESSMFITFKIFFVKRFVFHHHPLSFFHVLHPQITMKSFHCCSCVITEIYPLWVYIFTYRERIRQSAFKIAIFISTD